MCYSKNQFRYDGWMHTSGKVNGGATKLATGAYSTPCNARNTNTPKLGIGPVPEPSINAMLARLVLHAGLTGLFSSQGAEHSTILSVNRRTNVRVLLAQNTASACQVINFRRKVCGHTFRNNDRRGLTPQRPSDPTQRAVKAAQSVMYKKGK